MIDFQPPFTGDDRKRTMEKIINARLILPDYLSNDARELIRNVSTILPQFACLASPIGR